MLGSEKKKGKEMEEKKEERLNESDAQREKLKGSDSYARKSETEV